MILIKKNKNKKNKRNKKNKKSKRMVKNPLNNLNSCIYRFNINKTIKQLNQQTIKQSTKQSINKLTNKMVSFTFTKSQLDTFLEEIVSTHNDSEFEVKDLKKLIPKSSKNKKVKDPNAPKKATTSYFAFMSEVRSKVKEENPNLKTQEHSKIMGQMWRNMDSEDKKK